MMKTRIRSMWWKSLLSATAILVMVSCIALAPQAADAAEGDLFTGAGIAAGGVFASGSGTEADPYMIETAEQLASFATSVDDPDSKTTYAGEHVALGTDIDLSGIDWNPIGADGKPDTTQEGAFAGDFNGNNHTISGMTIRGEYTNAGLFSLLSSGAKIRDVVLTGVDIDVSCSKSEDLYAGGIVGQVFKCGKTADTATVIDGCRVSGSVSASSKSRGSYVGGILGATHEYPVIANCFSDAEVYAKAENDDYDARAGGIAGYTIKSKIANSAFAGITTATTTASGGSAVCGGIVAYIASDTELYNVYSAGGAVLQPRADQEASAGIIGGSENAGMGSMIYYATDARMEIKSESKNAVAFGYVNPNIYLLFRERYPDGVVEKTTANMKSEAFATTLNGNLKAVKDKTGIVPDKWVFDGNRVVLSTEKYKDEPQEDPAPDDPKDDPTPADPKDDPAPEDPKDDPAPADPKDNSTTDDPKPISIENAEVALTKAAFTYNGKVQKPAILTIGGRQLSEGADYRAVWTDSSSKKPGTYMVVIVGTGDYSGIAQATYTIKKAVNTLRIKAKTATVKFAKLKKKPQTLAATKVIKFVKKGQGEKKYVLVSAKKKGESFKKYFKINTTTGKVTVKKGLKKGTYKVSVKVKAAGNANFKPSAQKTAAFKVKVKVK